MKGAWKSDRLHGRAKETAGESRGILDVLFVVGQPALHDAPHECDQHGEHGEDRQRRAVHPREEEGPAAGGGAPGTARAR